MKPIQHLGAIASLLCVMTLAGAGCGQPPEGAGNDASITLPMTSTTTQEASSETKVVSSYSMSDVEKHNSRQSCWTAINGSVYNLTPWIDQHPGGAQEIISLCGIDGSEAFNDQHGGQRRPENELATFKIGTLKP